MPIEQFFDDIKRRIYIDFESKGFFNDDTTCFFIDKQLKIIEEYFLKKIKPPFLLLSDFDFDILSNYLVFEGSGFGRMTSVMGKHNVNFNKFSSVLKIFYLTVRNYIYKRLQQVSKDFYDEKDPFYFEGQHDLSVLGLSTPAYSLLKENYIDTVEEIISIGAKELKSFNGFGDNVLKEIAEKANAAGFNFDTFVR